MAVAANAPRDRNVHPDFARRIAQACEANGSVPAANYGRLNWFQKQYADRFGVEIATETVRKWFAGETKPRPLALRQLAEILQVDEAWLSLGTASDAKGRKPVQDATASGAVNLVAGLVQMDGGTIAFPEPDDKRAEAENITFMRSSGVHSIRFISSSANKPTAALALQCAGGRARSGCLGLDAAGAVRVPDSRAGQRGAGKRRRPKGRLH